MASGDMTLSISAEQVEQIATTIEGLNTQLKELLTTSKTTIDNLANTWTGTAAQTTIANYDGFAKKYFDNYEQIIASYVKYLRTNVASGFSQVERGNTTLAEAFK